jgi:hypothetical protein
MVIFPVPIMQESVLNKYSLNKMNHVCQMSLISHVMFFTKVSLFVNLLVWSGKSLELNNSTLNLKIEALATDLIFI